jgi:hypothetical protein
MNCFISKVRKDYEAIEKEYNLLKEQGLSLFKVYKIISSVTDIDVTDVEACVRVLREVELPKNFSKFSGVFDEVSHLYISTQNNDDKAGRRGIISNVADRLDIGVSTKVSDIDDTTKEKSTCTNALDNQSSCNEEVLNKEGKICTESFKVCCALPKSGFERFVDRIKNIFKR